jgi:hypothetical protein
MLGTTPWGTTGDSTLLGGVGPRDGSTIPGVTALSVAHSTCIGRAAPDSPGDVSWVACTSTEVGHAFSAGGVLA